MNRLEDTLKTTTPVCQALFKTISEISRKKFDDDGGVPPGIFVYTAAGELKVYDPPELSDRTKPMVWEMLKQIRSMNPITAFISEVWMSHPEKNAKHFVMPRVDPKREEKLMINLWDRDRMLNIFADIKRNPNSLGPWEVLFDSVFSQKNTQVSGAMMEGPTYKDSEQWN